MCIIKKLLASEFFDEQEFITLIGTETGRIEGILFNLEKEGFIERSGSRISMK